MEVREEGTGGTHVDQQQPWVDGGLGHHGRLQPQLLPHVFARRPRTRLVWRLGEGGAPPAGRAGGRLRGGGLAWASGTAAAAAPLPSRPRLPLCGHRPRASSAAANCGQREASTTSRGRAEPLTRGEHRPPRGHTPSHARTDLRILKNPCIPGIKPTWSWCMILLMCCWILFASILYVFF